MIMSGTSTQAAALGEKRTTLLLAPAKVMYFCGTVASSPAPHPFLPPLVSLFSINSSQSLYNPCNNPGERAGKTLFFLTLIPIDPILVWYLSLSQDISANRILRSQEPALVMYSRGEWDEMPIGNQIRARFAWEELSGYNAQHSSFMCRTHQSCTFLCVVYF